MSKNTNKKPLILAIETSGRIGSVALGIGQQVLGDKTFSTPVKHSSELFPAINNLLTNFGKTPDDIEHIYVSVGPGSFTGLRLAVTFAKIMHLANADIRIVAVDTLDVISANAIDYFQAGPVQNTEFPKTIASILDAKRGRFFIAAYRITSGNGPPEKILDDQLWTPKQFFEEFAVSNKPTCPEQTCPEWNRRSRRILLLGEGLVYYKKLFASEIIDFIDERYWYPSASKVLALGCRLAEQGQFCDPLTLTPKYIQPPEIGNL
jgi:tRNA threonylcarbamoyladenosine biosynthesis protein TsaB